MYNPGDNSSTLIVIEESVDALTLVFRATIFPSKDIRVDSTLFNELLTQLTCNSDPIIGFGNTEKENKSSGTSPIPLMGLSSPFNTFIVNPSCIPSIHPNESTSIF
jgi:hypothetical protein